MFNVVADISWLSVRLAFVAYFIIGALWFTLFFPKQYRISLGKENETPQKSAIIFIVGPAICCLIITIASAILISALKIDNYAVGCQL